MIVKEWRVEDEVIVPFGALLSAAVKDPQTFIKKNVPAPASLSTDESRRT
jgi:hypothetical protein